MKRAALAVLLCGCISNEEKLEAAERSVVHELGEKIDMAQHLDTIRKEVALLDQMLADAGIAAPAAPVPQRCPLPAPSLFEGEREKALRRSIDATERRIEELNAVLGDARRINVLRRAASQLDDP
jgi:hypothetical protein